MPLEMLPSLAVQATIPDCIPTALVAPVVGALTTAVVYQTRRLSRAADRAELMFDKLLEEVLHDRDDPGAANARKTR